MKGCDLVLDGIAAGRARTGPRTLHVDVTNGCNADCVSCWDHSPLLRTPRPAAWKRQRLEPERVEALLDDVLGLGGLRAVIVSGMGEPFTHPGIERILSAVKVRGLHLTVITNLVAADPERVLALGVDQLLVGIHAASEPAYLAFHPSFGPREWAKLQAALERFGAAGRRFKQVQVVCELNASELVEMVRLAHRTRAESVGFKLASLKEGTEAVRITEATRARLEDRLVPEARALALELGVKTNLELFAAQLAAGGAATAPIREVGCFMGFAYSRVLVDGTVLFCCSPEAPVGSLADGDRFSALWQGERWNELRDRLRRGEYFEGCQQCGKLAQNVKLGDRFARRHGEARRLEVTGRRAAP